MGFSKKELLEAAEKAIEFIRNEGSGNYIPVICDMIELAKEKEIDKNEQKQIFLEIIYNIKNSNIDTVLSGGKAIKNSFKDFINNYLCIKKINNQYIIENSNFKDLDINELEYVFLWIRRLVKNSSKKENKKNKKKHRNNNDYKKYLKKEKFENKPFANLDKLLK